MKYLVSAFLLALYPALALSIPKIEDKVEVAVFTELPADEFNSKIFSYFEYSGRSCAKCIFKNVTPYKSNGQVDFEEFPEAIRKTREQAKIIYLHWNTQFSKQYDEVVAEITKASEQGVIVVGSAGVAEDKAPTLPLNKTLVGKIPGAIVIGDLEGRERLPVRSFFGPEMLTAIKVPDEKPVHGIGSAIFVGRLAADFNQKSSSKDWINHFQLTKAKTRKLWPNLEDFFRR